MFAKSNVCILYSSTKITVKYIHTVRYTFVFWFIWFPFDQSNNVFFFNLEFRFIILYMKCALPEWCITVLCYALIIYYPGLLPIAFVAQTVLTHRNDMDMQFWLVLFDVVSWVYLPSFVYCLNIGLIRKTWNFKFDKMIIIVLLSAIVVVSVTALGKEQSIAVDGTLKCGTQPAEKVKVKLIDDDTGWRT